MRHSFVSGEVTFQPSINGLQAIIQTPQNVSLQTHQKKLPTAARTISGILAVISFLLIPLTSHAASYSAQLIVDQTNSVRAAEGLKALNIDSRLTTAAEEKAQDMIAQQYFSHNSPSGQTPWSWITKNHYRFTTAGENLAIDFVDGNDVVSAWMKSAEHRKNILDPNFHDIGVAIVDGTLNGQSTTIVVQLFGSHSVTQAPSIKKQVPNKIQFPNSKLASLEKVVVITEPTEDVPVPSIPVVRTSSPTTEELNILPTKVAQVEGAATHELLPLQPAIVATQYPSPLLGYVILGTFLLYSVLVTAAVRLQQGLIPSLVLSTTLKK